MSRFNHSFLIGMKTSRGGHTHRAQVGRPSDGAPSLRTSNARPYACLTQAHSLFYVPFRSPRGIFYPYRFPNKKEDPDLIARSSAELRYRLLRRRRDLRAETPFPPDAPFRSPRGIFYPYSFSKQKKKTPAIARVLMWRSRRDSNPRYAHHVHTISNRARYGHFDTAPHIAILFSSRLLRVGGPSGIRTRDRPVMSRML